MKYQRKVQQVKAVSVLYRLAELERRVSLLEAERALSGTYHVCRETEPIAAPAVRHTVAVWAVSPVGERCSGHGGIA